MDKIQPGRSKVRYTIWLPIPLARRLEAAVAVKQATLGPHAPHGALSALVANLIEGYVSHVEAEHGRPTPP